MNDAQYWIDKLELSPHVEGGYFKETYRSVENIDKQALPERFSGDRSFCTAINSQEIMWINISPILFTIN